MNRLDGKVAVITGGAGGIGIAAARRFAAEGANVLLVDLDEQALNAAVNEIGSNAVSYFVGDVTSLDSNQAMVETAEQRYGGVDIFLANAGVEGDVASIEDYDPKRFAHVMEVNVQGPFLGLKAAVPAMRKRGGGSVVITSSIAGVSGTPNLSAYGTSKHAVIGLMRSAAKEYAAENIRVNTVHPAQTETRMMRSIEEGMSPGAGEVVKAAMVERIPMQRYGDPNDIANIMLFLASDESTFMTGSTYMADGGSTA